MELQAARKIQNWWCHQLDPIRLRPIRKPFLLLRCGRLVRYDAFSLFEFIETTGDLRDPIAREPLATHEQMRLQRVCATCFDRSPWEMQRQFENEVERRELIGFLLDDLQYNLDEEDAILHDLMLLEQPIP